MNIKFLAVLLADAIALTAGLHAQQKTNIILVLTDDQGHCHLGAFADQYNKEGIDPKLIDAANTCMPTVDRMAAEGMRFINCHAAPTCAPSRTMLMTAQYPQNLGIYSNLDFIKTDGPEASVVFPVKALKEAGYLTAMIGKWHLGSQEGKHPNDKGFDYYFGFNSAQTEKYNSKILYRNKEKATAEGFLADQFTNEATNFIRGTKGKPFFMYLCYNDPHGPLPDAPLKYISKFKTGNNKNDNFYAYINAVDTGIDSVRSALVSIGQLENTIIIFASDNGPTDNMPKPGSGDLRWFKRSVYEGGVRVPLVAWWPGHVPAGKTNTDLVSFMDIMPTLLDAAKVSMPSSQNYDGKSFLAQLLLKSTAVFRTDALCWAGDSYPDSPEWKIQEEKWLAENPNEWNFGFMPAGWYVIKGKWKLVDDGYAGAKLYDLSLDKGEKTDLSAQNPLKVFELKNEFIDYMKNKPKPVGWYEEKWNNFFKVRADSMTGFVTPKIPERFKVYPNPVNTSLHYDFDYCPLVVEMYNPIGQIVLRHKLEQKTGNIDLDLCSGFYILNVKSENKLIYAGHVLVN